MIRTYIKHLLPYGFVRLEQLERLKETHINRAIRKINAQTYVEIGVRYGDFFRQIKCKQKIAIDPATSDFHHQLAAGESFYGMTSDNFFASKATDLFSKNPIDVALVDGLHEFTQTLRDVLSLTKFMSERGVIFIHDCNPPSRKQAEIRDGGPWNGDVWKVAYYLTKYQPELRFFTLDCDCGLGVVTNFNAANSFIYPSTAISNACKQLDYEVLEKQRKQILRLYTYWYSSVFFNFVHPRK